MLLSAEQRNLLAQSTETYNQSLWRVLDYLEERGISQEFAESEQLGYVDNPLPGQEQFRGRLSIPYITRTGCVNLKFRAVNEDDNGPKYLNLPGVETNLFHVESFFTAREYICVTEGEMDTLSLVQSSIPAVGVPGVKAWKSFYRRCFEDFPVIYAFCDGDEPGRDFGQFLSREIKARPILMPDGEDVNSMLVKEGPAWLMSKISK
jgi:DNA primase